MKQRYFTADPARLAIKLQPLALNQDITLKLLVDGREAHRLALIKRGEPLSWEKINWFDIFLCNTRLSHLSFDLQRGSLEFPRRASSI